MKKMISILLALAMILALMAGCGSDTAQSAGSSQNRVGGHPLVE